MKLTDFDFDLPLHLIAQQPSSIRGESSLLIIPKDSSDDFVKTKFKEIVNYLQAGDLLVFNDSKVIKAKLIFYKSDKKIECYLNKSIDTNNTWHCFIRPAKKINVGDVFFLDDNKITIIEKLNMGQTYIKFDLAEGLDMFSFLDKYGHIPLPPYIKRQESDDSIINDNDRYQTIYGKNSGSVAAHTAGLHFTDNLMLQLKNKGVEFAFITLHIGAGTFLPVKTENINDHKMHAENYTISKETADQVNLAKQQKRRVIAVGTTSMRTLEANANHNGTIGNGSSETDIFITPGYHFKIVDMLISNFHLPKSTLFMLACAFAGYKRMHSAYRYAVEQEMSFFSYGDATLSYLSSFSHI